ncbi:terminase large subunit [Pseudonocardia hispaniensis]|uniref:Terminase large subunit n=1 Tax=Pseudonocardia hispaniensis TaxID=904933 RepID=A0ABW1IYQ4_9PSEU
MTARGSWTDEDWAAQLDAWAAEGLIERTDWDLEPLIRTPEPTPQRGRPGYVPGAWFDVAAVEHFLRFALLLRHTKARWAGAPIRLFDWQVRWEIGPALGWKHPDGRRIITTLIIFIPRKNGKSTIASVISLYLWCADREPGAEVYAGAGDRQQAKIVYNDALTMAKNSPAIRKKAGRGLLRSVMEYPGAAGSLNVFRALSADGDRQHGLNVHGGAIDELHVHKSRWLVDAIETGTGSRDQPLIVIISTADKGEDGSIFNEKYELIENLAAGTVTEPTIYAVVFAADPDADPFAPQTQRAANPGYGLTVSAAYLAKEANRAAATPAYLNEYLRLHLNIRTKADVRWITMADWDASAQQRDTGIPIPVRYDELVGRACYAGLDLSSTTDLTALSLWFPPQDPDDPDEPHVWVPFFWLPEESVDKLARKTRIPFDRWAGDPRGHCGPLLRVTEGNVVDYRAVRELVGRLHAQTPIKALGYDPWNAMETALQLADDGITVEPVRQGYGSLSGPTKAMERLILGRLVSHGGHPLLRWNIDCAAVRQDPAGNVKPVKPDTRKSTKRIDGWVSGLNALAMHLLRSGPEAKPEPKIRVIDGRRR